MRLIALHLNGLDVFATPISQFICIKEACRKVGS